MSRIIPPVNFVLHGGNHHKVNKGTRLFYSDTRSDRIYCEYIKCGDGMRYCKIKGKFCVYATEHGYCSFTACREVTE